MPALLLLIMKKLKLLKLWKSPKAIMVWKIFKTSAIDPICRLCCVLSFFLLLFSAWTGFLVNLKDKIVSSPL